MRVIVNGEQREISSAQRRCAARRARIRGHAFRDRAELRRAAEEPWAGTPLKNGDEIEIITPRQGG